MFRRSISILVLLGFVAGQLAAVPHSHADYSAEEQRQHDARPHIHLGIGHGHEHTRPRQSHRHSNDEVTSPRSPQAPSDVSALDLDHDAGAIFLLCGASSLIAHTDQRAGQGVGPTSTPVAHGDTAMLWPADVLKNAPDRPPSEIRASTKLFLTLRNLRI